jgi:hypothetical protein
MAKREDYFEIAKPEAEPNADDEEFKKFQESKGKKQEKQSDVFDAIKEASK